MDLLDILSSAVVTVLVVVLIALRRTDRKIPIEDIPQERAKWEEKVRGKSRSALTRRPLAPSFQNRMCLANLQPSPRPHRSQAIKHNAGILRRRAAR